MYVPFAIRVFMAASTGLAIPLFFGIAIPYGAVPYGWPDSLNVPPDCFTWYSATGESAMATSARPEDSARLTAFWSLKIST